MKKRICMLLTAVMTVSVLMLAGCGGSSKPAETKATEAVTEAVTEAPTEAVTEEVTEAPTEAAGQEYTTIGEYLEDPDVKAQIDELVESYKDQIGIEVFAEGDDTLVYKYTFLSMYSEEEAKQIKANLEEQYDTLKTSMLSVASGIEDATPIEHLKVKLGYYLPDDTQVIEWVFENDENE